MSLRILLTKIESRVARYLTRNHRAARTFHDRLYREIERRLALRGMGNEQASVSDSSIRVNHTFRLTLQLDTQNDGLQWLIDTSPKKNPWSSQRLVGEVMGIWYGSVHTLSIVSFPSELVCVALNDSQSSQGCYVCSSRPV